MGDQSSLTEYEGGLSKIRCHSGEKFFRLKQFSKAMRSRAQGLTGNLTEIISSHLLPQLIDTFSVCYSSLQNKCSPRCTFHNWSFDKLCPVNQPTVQESRESLGCTRSRHTLSAGRLKWHDREMSLII